MAAAKKPKGNAGKGRPKGSKNKKTLAILMEEEQLRDRIRERMEPLLKGAFASAEGHSYLVFRDKSKGKFSIVTEDMLDTEGLPKDATVEVWDKAPNVEALKTLLDRAYGKAKEPDRTINLNVSGGLMQRVKAARERLAKRRGNGKPQ